MLKEKCLKVLFKIKENKIKKSLKVIVKSSFNKV